MSHSTRERWTAFLVTVLFGLACIFIIGQMTHDQAEAMMSDDGLPSISAIQKRLNEMEPDSPLRVDGKLGPATQAKWDRIFIRESVKQAWASFERED